MKKKITLWSLTMLMPMLGCHAMEVSDTLLNVHKANHVVLTETDSTLTLKVKGLKNDPGYSYIYKRSNAQSEMSNIIEKAGNMKLEIPFLPLEKSSSGKDSDADGTERNTALVGLPAFGMVTALGAPDGMDVKMSSSYEVLWDVFYLRHFSRNRQHKVEYGIGLDWRQYRMTGRTRFEKQGSDILLTPYPSGADINFSRAKVFSFYIPLRYVYSFGHQHRWSTGAAALLQFNTRASIKTIYNTAEGEHVKEFHRGIHQNRVTMDFMGFINYKGAGIYVKYSPFNVLDENYAPQFQSLSIGITLPFF